MPIKGLLFVLLVAALIGLFIEAEFGEPPGEDYYEEDYNEEFEEENEK